MSRSLLHEWEHDIVKYSINVGEMMKVAKDIYDTAYARGKAQAQEKTGHWINKTLIYKSEAGNEYDCYTGTCSVCGETQECWNYCGGCGSRMVSE